MPECYLMDYAGGSLAFARGGDVPEWANATGLDAARAPAGVRVVCRMGDPDLIHCAVYAEQNRPGGIFCVYGKNGLLFVATAATELVFAIAQGFFGELTANARYGADVFENMEIPDD